MASRVDMPVTIAGVLFRNPFYVASGPTTRTIRQLIRIEEAGWAAASIKLSIDPTPYINRVPRYCYLNKYDALVFTAEKRLSAEEGIALINEAKKELKHLVLMANITYAGEAGLSGWANMARRFEQAGADIIELNMCCPNMSFNTQLTAGDGWTGGVKTGASLGGDAEAITRIVTAIKNAVKIPVFVKLTPEGGKIASVARALLLAGADAVGSTGNRLGVPPINLADPAGAIFHLQDEISLACFGGAWLKPLAQRDTYEIRKACGPNARISATGGIRNAADAIEMALCGADLLGVCTETLVRGYDFLDEILEGTRQWLASRGKCSLGEVRDMLVPAFRSAAELTLYKGYAKVRAPALTAPCQAACPAGVAVQALMKKVSEKKFNEAADILMRTGPLQALCGYLCDAPCQRACIKGRQTTPLTIRDIERFLMAGISDFAHSPGAPLNGKTVAITHGGPAGLACAYALAMAGYTVSVYEGAKDILEMLPDSIIPSWIIPRIREVLTEIGIRFIPEEVDTAALTKRCDAVYSPPVPEDRGVSEYLGDAQEYKAVSVIGDGMLAALCARTALSRGARVVIVTEGPSPSSCVREAEAEGAALLCGAARIRQNGGDMHCILLNSGACVTVNADRIVDARDAFAATRPMDRVYADTTHRYSVASLIGMGKAAAAAIDRDQFGQAATIRSSGKITVSRARQVLANREYKPFERAYTAKPEALFTQEEAAGEAARCLRCGCGEGCAVCREICCEFAITLDESHRIQIDRAHCVACGMCMHRCPNGNIEMVSTGEKQKSGGTEAI